MVCSLVPGLAYSIAASVEPRSRHPNTDFPTICVRFVGDMSMFRSPLTYRCRQGLRRVPDTTVYKLADVLRQQFCNGTASASAVSCCSC